jgi:hypothetical protein
VEEIGQILVELFLQFFLEVLADVIWRRLPEPARLVIKALLSAGIAALLGGLSTMLAPAPLFAGEVLRVAYLVVAPAIIGLGMSWIGRYLVNNEKSRSTLEAFGFGWLFAFSFALTRYLLTL